jgi:hypothetical protein
MTLAGMSRFMVVDISNPKSTPVELNAVLLRISDFLEVKAFPVLQDLA